ncbi:MAG: class IV adenylate cyclase [Phycisphaerae bacterium]|jgi:predicted adenylyl cyclase CyaB
MASEIEVKFRLSTPQGLRRRLQERAAAPAGQVTEVNRMFDTADRRLLAADSGLRVRTCRAEGGATSHTLTYKGPRRGGPLKVREEIEVTVGDPAALGGVLARLGLREVVTFEKHRETWRVADCTVTLDELPVLGWYAEIEGPSAECVQGVRADLDLADTPAVEETYVHLAAAHGVTDADGCVRLLFEP